MKETLQFNEYERIVATTKDLAKCTMALYMVIEDMKIDRDLKYSVIKLHNSAVDFIEAYNKYLNENEKEEN